MNGEFHDYSHKAPWVLRLKWDDDRQTYDMHGLWYDRPPKAGSDTRSWDLRTIADEPQLLRRMEIDWNSSHHKRTDEPSAREAKDIRDGELHTSDPLEKIRFDADVKFWSHEWNKHGRVSGMHPHQYFRKAFQLFDLVRPQVPSHKTSAEVQFHFDENFRRIA